MEKHTKIGFLHVAIGLACFVIVSVIVGLIGIYESSTGIAIATGVMSAMMMQACKVAYVAGKTDAKPKE